MVQRHGTESLVIRFQRRPGLSGIGSSRASKGCVAERRLKPDAASRRIHTGTTRLEVLFSLSTSTLKNVAFAEDSLFRPSDFSRAAWWACWTPAQCANISPHSGGESGEKIHHTHQPPPPLWTFPRLWGGLGRQYSKRGRFLPLTPQCPPRPPFFSILHPHLHFCELL